MKKNKYLWVGLVLTLVCMPVFGQEFTKRTQLYKSEGMIIRDYTGNSWLVHNRYYEYDGSKRDVFILFTETGTTAGMMYLPEQVACVNDFEIYDKTAYFAGCNTDGVGIMGYFDLTTFPTTTVKICPVPVMATFERLDVGVCNNTLHVFLTGEEVLGGSHMADARLVGTDQWRFEISVNTALVDRFDDVAVLSSGVAFSGRKTADKRGYMFLFPALTMSPSIFSATADCLCFANIVMDRIRLDAGTGNNLALVFRNTFGYEETFRLSWNTLIQGDNMGAVFENQHAFEGSKYVIEAIEEECLEATIPVVTTCSEDRTDR